MTKTPKDTGVDTPLILSDGDDVTARWVELSKFGLDRPSGNTREAMNSDLTAGKRVLLQRGVSIQNAIRMQDMGPGVVQFIASTDGVKRDGNEIDNTGWVFDNFSKNPVFLFGHDYRSLPIGKHVKWAMEKLDGKSILRIWTQFVDAETYPFAERVRKMYEGGFLRAVSVGWTPLQAEPRKDSEGRTVGWRFLINDLLELSAVPVPSDPDAIIEAINQRILAPEDVDLMSRQNEIKVARGIAYTLSDFDVTAKERELEAGDEPTPTECPETPAEPVAEESAVEDVRESNEVLVAVRELGSKIDNLCSVLEKRFAQDVVEAATEVVEAVAEAVEDIPAREEEIPAEPVAETPVEPETRKGSRLSAKTMTGLKECARCIDDAANHLRSVMAEDEEDETDLPEPENPTGAAGSTHYNAVDPETEKRLDDAATRLAELFGLKDETPVTPTITIDDVMAKLDALKRSTEDTVVPKPRSKYVEDLFREFKLIK